MELTTVWFVLIAVLWTGYFVLEGFDFGVGMLLPRARPRDDTRARGVLINTIGPVWDGNEVWLLTAGGATFAAFPEWYATLFSGFYLPLLLILVALIVRGVAFEYRGKRRRRPLAGALGRVRSSVGSLRAGAAVGRRVRQHRARRADRRRRTSTSAASSTLLNPYALLGGLTTLALFVAARRGVPGAEDRRRDPRAGPAGAGAARLLVGRWSSRRRSCVLDAARARRRRWPGSLCVVAALGAGRRRGRRPGAA